MAALLLLLVAALVAAAPELAARADGHGPIGERLMRGEEIPRGELTEAAESGQKISLDVTEKFVEALPEPAIRPGKISCVDCSVLAVAAMGGNLDAVKKLSALSEFGTWLKEICAIDADGDRLDKPPMELAALMGHLDVLRFLLDEKHYDVSLAPHAVAMATFTGHKDVIRYLLEKGARVRPPHDDEDTEGGMNDLTHLPLHLAAWRGDPELMEMLLKDGSMEVDQNVPEIGTPLLVACGTGNKEMVTLLIKHGADPKHRPSMIEGPEEQGPDCFEIADMEDFGDLLETLRVYFPDREREGPPPKDMYDDDHDIEDSDVEDPDSHVEYDEGEDDSDSDPNFEYDDDMHHDL